MWPVCLVHCLSSDNGLVYSWVTNCVWGRAHFLVWDKATKGHANVHTVCVCCDTTAPCIYVRASVAGCTQTITVRS